MCKIHIYLKCRCSDGAVNVSFEPNLSSLLQFSPVMSGVWTEAAAPRTPACVQKGTPATTVDNVSAKLLSQRTWVRGGALCMHICVTCISVLCAAQTTCVQKNVWYSSSCLQNFGHGLLHLHLIRTEARTFEVYALTGLLLLSSPAERTSGSIL